MSKLSRRSFLKGTAVSALGAAALGPPEIPTRFEMKKENHDHVKTFSQIFP